MNRPTEDEERLFRDFLQRRTGFAIPEGRWRFLAPRFFARLEGRGFSSVRSYLHYLESDRLGRTELEDIFSLLTVRKTSFFRNPNSYQALADEVLPRLDRERPRDAPLALWSAGCATGEEPYTMAMVCRATFERSGRPCYVLATDIVREALATAREASYPEANLVGIPPEYRRFVRNEGGRGRVCEEVREMVEFSEHNLVHDPLPRSAVGQWDVLFCRNVFIYFEAEQAQEIVQRFARVLAPGGALFLGHAEVITGLHDAFEVVFWGDTFYYRRRADPRLRPLRSAVPPPAPRVPSPADGLSPEEETKKVSRALLPRKSNSSAPNAPARRGGGVPTSGPATRRLSRALLSQKTLSSETHRWGGVRLPREQVLKAERARQVGDLEGAARALRSACAQAPRWAKPRVLLAEVYLERGDAAAALEELTVATEVEPLSYKAHALLGGLHLRQGEFERAEASLRRALYLEPDFVSARYDLAQTLRGRGATAEACRELRSLLRTLRSLDPAGLMVMTQGLKIPSKDLRSVCEREISEMGGSSADSGIWQIPPPGA
ncbi:MAG: methyltransferase domain-containing protein [Planctomycetota bacterium]|nr:MAG: methyltransferase domain-containing protein [Planctomycetota bacterium]